MAGMSPSGFEIATQAQLLTEIQQAMRTSPALNPNGRVNLSPDSVLGVVSAIVADKLAELWQVMQAVYSSQYRGGAEGASLDALADLVGVTRSPATGGRVTLAGTGTNGTFLTAGRRVRDPARPSVEWVTIDNVIIAGGVFTVEAQANVNGPITANAGTLNSIVTPVAGWSTVTNPADAAPGSNDETDASLRQKMTDLFFGAGSRTTGAIRSAVMAVAGVTEAYVFENVTDTVNAFGVPGRNIEVVVEGGDDNDIGIAIYNTKSEGIGTYTATGDSANVPTAYNLTGDLVDIFFSRPVPVVAFVYVEVESDGSNVNVVADMQAALAAFGDSFTVGSKIRRTRFIPQAYGVAGVAGVPRLGISKMSALDAIAGAANLQDIVLQFRENGVFDTTRVAVVLV